MRPLLGIVCTLNFGVAILVLAGYIIYALHHGLPIDQEFLMLKRGFRFRHTPMWTLFAIFDAVFAVIFIVSQFVKLDLGAFRMFCTIFGGFFLLALLIGWLMPLIRIMPPISDEGDILPRPTVSSLFPAYKEKILTVDGCVALYLWTSLLAYGLFGGKKLIQSDGVEAT